MRWQFWFQNKWLITYLKASSKEEVKSSWNIDEMDCDLSLAPSTLFFYHSFPCSTDCKPKMLPLSFSSWIKLLFWSMFFHWKASLNIKKKGSWCYNKRSICCLSNCVHTFSRYTDCLVRYSENCPRFCPIPGGTVYSTPSSTGSVGIWH